MFNVLGSRFTVPHIIFSHKFKRRAFKNSCCQATEKKMQKNLSANKFARKFINISLITTELL